MRTWHNAIRASLAGVAVLATLSGSVLAQTGQVNISGATLFQNFFDSPGSTNDAIDVDGDGFAGFQPATPPFVDQLARSNWNDTDSVWTVQYRGVGSGNGLKELDTYYAGFGGLPPLGTPTDLGIINRQVYWDGVQMGPAGNPDNEDWGYSPVPLERIDIGVMDVPTRWFVQNVTSAPAWNRNPTGPGYGTNPQTAWDSAQSNKLKTLSNLNTKEPAEADALTVFDTEIAWVPISYISNRGTGMENVKVTELQHLFVTGRMPNGENLVGATRDSGSGTRNGGMNSLGIDPSYGRGDNVGDKLKFKVGARIGWNYDADSDIWRPHQPTNCGGSSVMEEVVQNRQLAVGYTGLMGGSRSAADAASGKYELLNVMKDNWGGTEYVRPSLDGVLDNADPDTGWQFGGPETMATVGDPLATAINDTYGVVPGHAGNPEMANPAAAAYIRNIVESIAAFTGDPSDDESLNMPGELLATQFVLVAGVDAFPSLTDSDNFSANPVLNQTVQDFIRANNVLDVPDYGITPAGKVPLRGDLTSSPGGTVPTAYSDGSVDGSYKYWDGAWKTVAGANTLNARNALSGDFNNDGVRDIDDVEALVTALNDPRAFQQAEGDAGGASGDLTADNVIPEIIGDFNGDGDFDADDVRYFCDGLAIDPATGTLDRVQGFARAEAQWAALGGGSLFGTGSLWGSTMSGLAACDVAGNPTAPGADPRGYDGMVDWNDLDYVLDNFGDWTDLDQAVEMDLSCDMTGDLQVDLDDVHVIGCGMGTPDVDLNGDGETTAADIDYLRGLIGTASGDRWLDRDGDGVISENDVTLAIVMYTKLGDATLDGNVDAADLSLLAGDWQSTGVGYGQGDLTGDSNVDAADLSLLAANWQFSRSCGVAASAEIPEPMTVTLLGLGGLAILRRRSR